MQFALRPAGPLLSAAKAEHLQPNLQQLSSGGKLRQVFPQLCRADTQARMAYHKLDPESLEIRLKPGSTDKSRDNDLGQVDEYTPAHRYGRDKPTGSRPPDGSNPGLK